MLALLIGFLVGIVVGALGAGGGILSVPVLVYLLAQPPHAATAESLVIVGVTAGVSLVFRARKKQVNYKGGLIFGCCSLAGTFVGTYANALVPAKALMIAFAILLFIVAAVMFRMAKSEGEQAQRSPAAPRLNPYVAVVGLGSLVGLLTGFFGVGGGFAIVPALMLGLGYPIHKASGTSLLIMVIASLGGLIPRLVTGVSVDWAVVVAFTVSSALGGLVGGPLSQKVRPATLTLLFAGLLSAVAVATLAGELIF